VTPGPDHLRPLDAVPVGRHTVVPDLSRPVAAVVEGDRLVRWVTWPGIPLPDGAVEEAEALPTPAGVWMLYRSDTMDDAQRTAVFVSPDGAGDPVDIGDRRPLGADTEGLWLGDPRDASAWMQDDEDDDDEPGELVDPETLAWAESEPFWPDRETWTEPGDEEPEEVFDVHASADDDDETDGDVGPAFEWSAGFADDGDEDEPFDFEPPQALPTTPTELTRIAPDGTRTTVTVDHLVDGLESDGSTLTLRYHPSGPRSVRSEHGGWDVVYEPRQVVVAVHDGLPTELRTDGMPSIAVDEDDEDDVEEWERRIAERDARREPFIDRFDLAGVAGATWPLWDRGEADAARHVARLRSAFEGLGEPSTMWTRGSDEPLRVRSDYRSVEIDVEGDWPDTAVVVSFEHSAVPFLRLRRRYRVFDDAGHPVEHGYVIVYLDEEILTGHIPPRSAAVDGVLDI
jgi:hypothetical protein